MSTGEASFRSEGFRKRPHGRYWWHTLPGTDYVPSVYRTLSDSEWLILDEWFAETERQNFIGEINVPASCLIQGIVSGGGIRRIVQLGHFYGYSSLLLGFVLRAMDARPGLFSVDISEDATRFTESWIDYAGLGDYVSLYVGDSASEGSLLESVTRLGGAPQLVIIDSSHEYAHTLAELERWVPHMPTGSIMLLHDTSRFAQAWDSTGCGGVMQAVSEWIPRHPEVSFINLNGFVPPGALADQLVYKDACGMGILQKIA